MPLLKIVCTCNNIKERTRKPTCKWRWSDSLGVNPKCPLIIIGQSLRGHLHVCGQNWWAHQFVGGKSHDFSVIFSSHVLANLMLTKLRGTFQWFAYQNTNLSFLEARSIMLMLLLTVWPRHTSCWKAIKRMYIYLNINEPQSTALEK